MVNESLELRGGGPGLRALIARAVGLDVAALVRLRQLDENTVDVFVTTPFEVVASRRVEGTVSRDGAVVSANALHEALLLGDAEPGTLELGPARDPSWPGALPPATGFVLLDTPPVEVVRELSDKGQQLARQFSGPLGPPASLLNQTVVTVTGPENQEVGIPMRMIFACTNLGLIPGFAAPMDIPRHLRVSGLGRWVRVDAPFGSVYRSTRLSLF
ncbi:hypothetical protein [Corynebacterium striatum]|uniref:hypothetical protein n=1 Tax=Corynebacterium striatum TaxID=43770 RepID=UPI00254CB5BA|nr:hypothetical protein [Corynebacterium striatum]MDK8808299.1 hypothetical protein [Corynebacterium striatum]MDK8877201.1 hypothetical protein [Corynebacterium striatum]